MHHNELVMSLILQGFTKTTNIKGMHIYKLAIGNRGIKVRCSKGLTKPYHVSRHVHVYYQDAEFFDCRSPKKALNKVEEYIRRLNEN